MSEPEFSEGQSFEIAYPFVRDTYEGYDSDGPTKTATWKPGVRFEMCGPDDTEAVADAEGSMSLLIIAVVKPGRFPKRIFFTRKFKPPGNVAFGKSKLHMVTQEKFRRLSRSYQYGYSIRDAGPQPQSRSAPGEGAEECSVAKEPIQ